jgi:(p)ppGpp synthase/HD superfamily hydrolase
MTRLGKAIALASEVHQDHTDKADAPYMLHCIAVMQAVAPDEDAMIVGVLHDVLEDCERIKVVEYSHRIAVDFGPVIFDALDTLCKERGEDYGEYIERVAQNYLARKVKIADLTHNMDPRRIPSYQIVDKDFQRWEKYRRALIRLEREP